jgi:hypothetical protein
MVERGVGERRIQLLGNVKQLFSQEKTERSIGPTDDTAVGLALLIPGTENCKQARISVGEGDSHSSHPRP